MIAWDMNILSDKRLKPNRPNITVVHKDAEEWTHIDKAVPAYQDPNY